MKAQEVLVRGSWVHCMAAAAAAADRGGSGGGSGGGARRKKFVIGFASWRARVKVLFDVGVGGGGLCEDCSEV